MSTVGRRILVVDDDEQLVALLSIRLMKAGYSVTPATKAEDGYRLAMRNEHDVIVLDLMMPRIDGIEICAGLRARGIMTPILVLSGQTEKDVVVRGLNAGADDYLTKPFNDYELIARIRALMRRSRKAYLSKRLERCNVTLDIAARTVRRGSTIVLLTRKETLLLKRLMAESPEPVTRLALLQDVWGIGNANASNRLDVYIRRLRKKLVGLGGGTYVQTLRSGGYYFGRIPSPLPATTTQVDV